MKYEIDTPFKVGQTVYVVLLYDTGWYHVDPLKIACICYFGENSSHKNKYKLRYILDFWEYDEDKTMAKKLFRPKELFATKEEAKKLCNKLNKDGGYCNEQYTPNYDDTEWWHKWDYEYFPHGGWTDEEN